MKILDFQHLDVLAWLAELMKHRDAADTKRYRMLAEKFIQKYGIDTSEYDIICGWRANASYFYIAKEFVRDNIDMDILEELLAVPYSEFNDRYNQRDVTARRRMRELVDSDANKVTKVFSNLFER